MGRGNLLILAIFNIAGVSCVDHCGKFGLSYFAAENRALINKIIVVKTARSMVICVRECAMLPQCSSVNFHTDSRRCELGTGTRIQNPESFDEIHEVVYIDTIPDTPLHSVRHLSSCEGLLNSGFNVSGEYKIYPNGFWNGLLVYCDMETDGGGWIVMQRRQDGSVDFYRNWVTYRAGFGNLSGEFWLGNDILLNLTKYTGWWKLRVELEDWEKNTAWAEFGEFGLQGNLYRVRIGRYDTRSTLPDSLTWHNGRAFSTYDNDNDTPDYSCAQRFGASWWFGYCTTACLNGRYYHQARAPFRAGIHWESWKGKYYSMKGSTMKIK
ncbi:ficolin-3-like [Acanthaster planci]|uniref:Ficolin-3-like n=1 Tax=Acanthaster planci TaxID=133434 RepID=A0A8B7YWH5_ACAPL|nr:ficolin-3-like [Acanthaster planci]XP_022096845.1 ficolin-3-like [Acanthaster planci]